MSKGLVLEMVFLHKESRAFENPTNPSLGFPWMVWPSGINPHVVGFLRGRCSRGGGNLGTLRIPREDWGTLQNIRED